MLFLPYRAKNPPERVPWVTWGLILLNTLIFALTCDAFLTVRKEIVEQFAVTHNQLTFGRMLTAIFLHGNLLHVAGNMLFLWIFGSSVEGRVGHGKYLLLYLVSGYAGGFLQDVITGLLSPDTPSLGASGAVMGMAGAYLYLFPHSTICILFSWGYWTRWDIGTIHWPAWGVIALYLGLDVLNGLAFLGADGVAHFAHIGGAVAGFLGVLAMRAPRDSNEYSEAQEMRDDFGNDYDALPLAHLETLIEGPASRPEMALAYVRKAARDYAHDPARMAGTVGILQRYAVPLSEKADPVLLTQALLSIPETAGPLPGMLLLRLSAVLERTGNFGLAIPLLQRLYRQDTTNPDAELALLRLARISEGHPDKTQAIAQYREILRLYPNGRRSLEVRDALLRLGVRP
ncbi:MAG: rhomboid family intramembrane serine protease [Capsulimonadales bacterium]|nr:rhomboid family intramembrane serine protease [Capsulimonadales bacterium]